MTPGEWQEVDSHILAGHSLLAMLSIRKYTGVGVKDALDIHVDRYKQLRLTRSADFKCDDEEYWRDVYS